MATKKCLTNPIFLFICSLILLLCTGNAQKDTIKPSEALTYFDKLVSADGRFTLGFFVLGNSDNVYLGIWYSNDHDAKVWVANRNSPVYEENGPNLTMDADGILRIMRGGGSSVQVNPNQAAPNSVATLEITGNFVIRELKTDGSPKQVLWESFDHPTDTLLPGMKLGSNLQTGLNWTLTSWLSETIAAPGTFTLEWNSSGQLVMRRRGVVYWNSGNMNHYSFENIPWLSSGSDNLSRVYSFSNVSNENESYFNYEVNDGSISWWRLDYDGKLWDTTKVHLVNGGSCDGFTSNPGCAAQKQPKCRRKNDTFEQRRGQFKGRALWSINENSSFSDCWADCWNNCSCGGYTSFPTNDTAGCQFYSSGIDFMPYRTGEIVYVLNKSSAESLKLKWWIWIVIAVVAVSAILLLGSLYYLRKKKLQRDRDRNEEHLLFQLTPSNRFSDEEGIGNEGQKGHDLKVISFASIMDATNHFSPENKLGQGGFGPVYKGKLPEGKEIAVKRLSSSSGQGLVELKNELILIAKLQHMNLVRLLGFCVKGEEKMLIYEYMPNKSLDFFLFDPTKREMLDWPRRNHIIEGIAQGLLYLHKYSRVKIIHRDLKVSNILLDDDMNPKISDFGMARIFERKKSEANTERIVGTYGYMSPEYAIKGIFSEKSDVYSFGVLMLEIVSGRKNSGFYYNDGPISLVGYAWELWKEGKSLELIDSALGDSYSRPQVLRCIHVGLLCVQENAADRPTMSDVISALANEAVPLPPPIPKQSASSGQPEQVEEGCSGGVTVSEITGR